MKKDKHIEQLLNRFLDGTSTLEEEAQLAAYFRTHSVPREWQAYQDMFALFDQGEVEVKPKAHRRYLWPWVAAAAAVVLLALIHPQLFKETTRLPEPLSQMAKADTARTQQPKQNNGHQEEPEEVVKEIERLKYETPKHLMAASTPKPKKAEKQLLAENTPMPQNVDRRVMAAAQPVRELQPTSAVGNIDNADQPQGIAEIYTNLSIEEYLAEMAREENAEVQAIRERGKQLERSMMASSPGMY